MTLFDFFVCPYCHSEVEWWRNRYICQTCSLHYPYEHDIYYFCDENNVDWQKAVRGPMLGNKHHLSKPRVNWSWSRAGYPYNMQDKHIDALACCALLTRAKHLTGHILLNGKRGYLLDIAAGPGWMANQLSRYKKVIAVDVLDHPACGIGCINSDVGEGMVKVIADGAMLPIPDGAIEAVFMNSAYHHFEHKVKALNEWWRVLSNGGMLVMMGENPPEKVEGEEIGAYSYNRDDLKRDAEESNFGGLQFVPIEYIAEQGTLCSSGVHQLEHETMNNGLIIGVKGG